MANSHSRVQRTLLAASMLGVSATPAVAEFRLSSPDLAAGVSVAARHVFNGGGCRGANVSPALSWSGAPAGTLSFAVTVFDPDAPTGHGWWHWVLFNIPPDVYHLAAGPAALPRGSVQTRNDFGTPGYGGPCPPPGPAHRYVFTVHALNIAALPFNASDPPARVGAALDRFTLGRATITARYGR